jgi:hypothetical protein
MTPKEYEKAVLEYFKILWPSPRFLVKHNDRLPGRRSRKPRQIDISIFEAGKSKPALIVEVKRHRRPIDLVTAGSTIALVQDVGGMPGVMVSTSSFSVAARNHLAVEGIEHLTITLKDANALQWIPLVEKKFAVDRAFKMVSGQLVEALRNGDAGPFLDTDVPYEEWIAVMECGQELFSDSTYGILKILARDHFDDGVRFNAIAMLDDAGKLDARAVEALLAHECNAETLELLRDLLDR